LKADHHGVAAFGNTTRDEDNLKKVLSNVDWLYEKALALSMLESLPSPLEVIAAVFDENDPLQIRMAGLRR